jgi:hypothetical protein
MRTVPYVAVFAVVLATGCCPAAIGGEARFAVSPRVRQHGDQYRVEFSAAAATDCAVWVLDGQGSVVRHLAAGVLGPNAPPPLQQNSLAQSLAWDGKDDAGRPAAGGPWKARVALGLAPQLDGFLGFEPLPMSSFRPLDSIRALAVGPRGELFVFYCFGSLALDEGTLACCVLDRQGQYLRTIMPYPANLPDERLRGLKRIEREAGVKVPFLYQGETRSFVPGAGEVQDHRAIATGDGRVAFMGVLRKERHGQPTLQMVTLGADGGVAEGAFGARFPAGIVSASLALSPDERTLYASDVRREGGFYGKPVDAIYRFGWNDREPTVLALRWNDAAGEHGLSDPKGIAVDREGNVLVADKGHDRLVVFRADGVFLAQRPMERPERVELDRRTGAVYVLGGRNIDCLQKLDSWQHGRVVATTTIPFFKHQGYRVTMALDDRAERPILWLATAKRYYAKFTLLRIEDEGLAFGRAVDVGSPPHAPQAAIDAIDVTSLSLNRREGLLQIGGTTYPVASAAASPAAERRDAFTELKARPRAFRDALSRQTVQGTGSFGLDGNFYVQVHTSWLLRFDPQMNLLPFAAGIGPRGAVGGIGGLVRVRGRGVTADAHGNVYVLWEKAMPAGTLYSAVGAKTTTERSTERFPDAVALSVYGPDGHLRSQRLIDSEIRGVSSVRLDPQGNIYLALAVRPGQTLLPPWLNGKVPDEPKAPDAVGAVNYYPLVYGSLAKFGPEGGRIAPDCGGTSCNYGYGPVRKSIVQVQGAQWIFSGISSVPSFRMPGAPGSCQCDSPRFDVDGFGRSFFPDAAGFRVGVLDTAGNLIAWFGAYGNQDSAGPGSLVPVPAIPLAWPQAVAVDDATAYIGDRLNRRVVCVRLRYGADATCELLPGRRCFGPGDEVAVRSSEMTLPSHAASDGDANRY